VRTARINFVCITVVQKHIQANSANLLLNIIPLMNSTRVGGRGAMTSTRVGCRLVRRCTTPDAVNNWLISWFLGGLKGDLCTYVSPLLNWVASKKTKTGQTHVDLSLSVCLEWSIYLHSAQAQSRLSQTDELVRHRCSRLCYLLPVVLR